MYLNDCPLFSHFYKRGAPLTFYILLQIVLLSFVLYSFNQKASKKVAAFYAVIFLLVVSVIRYGIGIDFFSYQDYYEEISNGGYIKVEYGFIILSELSNFLGLGFQGVVAGYSILTILLLTFFYSRFSNNFLLTIYIFTMLPILYLSSFNVIRQFLTVAIFAYSINYILEKKLFIYILSILFAAFFVHKSALLMLPMYFILTRNLNGINYSIIIFLYMVSLQFIDFIVLKLGFSGIYLNGEYKNTGVNYLVFVYLLVFIYIFILKNKLINHRPENVVFINMTFICTLISFSPLFSDLPSAPFLRLTSFFTIAMPIIMVNVLPIIKNYRLRLVYFLGIVFAPTLYFYVTLIFKGGLYKLTPYSTFVFN